MSGIDGLGPDLLRALRDEPLDVHQLAAELAVIPVAVTTELKALMDRGLVPGVTMESGRRAWGLTVKGRTRLAEGAKP
jgi:hypothetical protein